MSFEEQVKNLSRSDVDEISYHYDNAMDTEHSSGDHWILMSVLDKYGFRAYGPTKAMEMAEEIIALWDRLPK